MRIGIDISQIIYEGTGVGEYTKKLIETLLSIDKHNHYVLFYSNLRKEIRNSRQKGGQAKFEIRIKSQLPITNYQLRTFRIPTSILEFLWNRLHVCPIEWFVGDVDVFLTSDWLEPPTIKAKKVTTIHDLSIFKTPESFDRKIVEVHKRKLKWVKKEASLIICDSIATKKDAIEILGIEEKRLRVIYPGV